MMGGMDVGLTPWLHYVLLGGVFMLAGGVKGVVGLGLPTVSMALLALWMPPVQAAALLIVPSLVSNIAQMLPLKTLGQCARRLAPLQIGTVLGTWLGLALWGAASSPYARQGLGVALVLYGLWGMLGKRWIVPARQQKSLGGAAGLCTGLVVALTGVFVVPAVAYMQALQLQRDELVQAMGLSFTVSTAAFAIGMAAQGQVGGTDLAQSIWLLVPTGLGLWAGTKLRQHLSPLMFKRGLFGGLVLLGVYMLTA